MEKLRGSIIGLGHQATEDHIPGILDSESASLVGICDTIEKKVETFRKKLGVPGYTQLDKMLEETHPDFVIISVPHNAYREIIEETAKRHIHMLKEKPFARNLEEALYFKRLTDENNVQLMVTLQRRFNPIYTTFFQLKDQIGKPFYIEGKYTLFVENPDEGWRSKREYAGGGVIIDLGYHMIDLLMWYFGLPDHVHAEFSSSAKPDKIYDAEDTASILFRYSDQDLNGTLTFSRFYPPKTEQLKVLGSRGIIELERGKIRRLRSNGEVAETLIREHTWPAAATSQIEYFCQVIRGEKPNIGSPDYHLNHMSFIDACYISKESGKYVNPREVLKSHAK